MANNSRNSRFQRGSGVYACNTCGRRTRQTGTQSLGSKLCSECYELAGIENDISDGHTTLADATAEIRQHVSTILAKGGSVEEWRQVFGFERSFGL